MFDDRVTRLLVPGSTFLLTLGLHTLNTQRGRDLLEDVAGFIGRSDSDGILALIVAVAIGGSSVGYLLSTFVVGFCSFLLHHSRHLAARFMSAANGDATAPHRMKLRGLAVSQFLARMDLVSHTRMAASLRDYLVRRSSLVFTSMSTAFAMWVAVFVAAPLYVSGGEPVYSIDWRCAIMVQGGLQAALAIHAAVAHSEYVETIIAWLCEPSISISTLSSQRHHAYSRRMILRLPYSLWVSCAVLLVPVFCAFFLPFEVEPGQRVHVLAMGLASLLTGLAMHSWLTPDAARE